MTKSNLCAVILMAITAGALPMTSAAAEKKPAKTQAAKEVAPAKLTPEEVAAQIAYLEKMQATLTRCHAHNKLSESTLNSSIRAESMMGGDVAAVIKKHRESPLYKQCEKEATANFQATSREFVSKFREPKLQDKAKDALAQWMTALDAASNENFAQEASKFSTLANGVKLELSLN